MGCSSVGIQRNSRAEVWEFARRLRADTMAGLRRNLNANQRALERNQRPTVVDLVSAFCNALFGALFRPRCSIDVDLMSALGRLSENAHLVGLHFNESPRNN